MPRTDPSRATTGAPGTPAASIFAQASAATSSTLTTTRACRAASPTGTDASSGIANRNRWAGESERVASWFL